MNVEIQGDNTRSHAPRGNVIDGRSARQPHQHGRGAAAEDIPTQSVGTSSRTLRPTARSPLPALFSLLLAPCSLLLLLAAPLLATSTKAAMGGGAIEAEAKSDYSLIRVRKQGSILSMNFVRDNGEEHIQTLWNSK